MYRLLPVLLVLVACGSGPDSDWMPSPTTAYNGAGDLCLLDYEVCKNRNECCSGICFQKDGWWYARCLSPDPKPYQQSNLEFGYYERQPQCQFDACGGPLPDRIEKMSNPVRQ